MLMCRGRLETSLKGDRTLYIYIKDVAIFALTMYIQDVPIRRKVVIFQVLLQMIAAYQLLTEKVEKKLLCKRG